ncbi:MAG: insulinase family protein [Clostridia bacterium]|nr:insulinase family protein [Clostridia bacterium]
MSECTVFRSASLRETYTKIKHKSGLDIYVFPKKLTTTYAIFATRYGSVDTRFKLAGDADFSEVPDGVAHFLEHKMFDNEDGVDSFARFSAYGADANAYTSHHRTAYLFSCTENFSESLAELLTYVTHPYFTPESVAKEQGIIGQEIRMGDDNPAHRRYYNLLRALFHGKQIYTNICGTVESIAQITDQILYDCCRVFYHPCNMALVVCGDVTVEEVLTIADQHLPMREPVEIIREYPPEPESVYMPKITAEMSVAQPMFSIGIKDPCANHEPADRLRREAAFSILCEMLFNKSGDLYNTLYREGLLLGGLGYGYESNPGYAYVSLNGNSHDPDAVLARIKAAIADAQQNGLSATAFARCKRVMYAEFVRDFDSTADIADMMLDFVFADVEPLSYAEVLDSITFAEVEALLKEAFCPERFAMSVINPIKEG